MPKKKIRADQPSETLKISGPSMSERAKIEYDILLQTSLDGFWVNDSSGRILDANQI